MEATGRRAEAVAMLTRTRSDIVWTQELAALLESLAQGLPFEEGGEEAEITRVTTPRNLDRERRVGERRQSDRRHTPVESPSENTVRMAAVQFGEGDMREDAAAAPTPPPRPTTPPAPPTRTPPPPLPRAHA